VILTVWKLKEPTLVTIGDAVASFLYDPDPTTKGICLSTKSDIQNDRWKLQPAKPWNPTRHFWFRAASVKRWLICNILYVFTALHSSITNPDNLQLYKRYRIRNLCTPTRYGNHQNLQYQRTLRARVRLRKCKFRRRDRPPRLNRHYPVCQPATGNPFVSLFDL